LLLTKQFCIVVNAKKYPSRELRNLAPERCKFGYDVMEYVGRALFVECRRDIDIVADLKNRNIEISDSEVPFLGKKFIIYLAIAHRESRDRIRSGMDKRGGYILHLDGTCDGDSPHLISGMDGLSEIILGNIKAPSENSEVLIPFLKDLKQSYGPPLALVHDMGSGLQKAINEVFPGISDYICHFHFLRDIGKDLLGKNYGMIRKCLQNSKARTQLRTRAKSLQSKLGNDNGAFDEIIQSLKSGKVSEKLASKFPDQIAFVLIQWILDADNESDGYGFPFDRHHFVIASRLFAARKLIEQIKDHSPNGADMFLRIKSNNSLVHLLNLLNTLLHNKHLCHAVRDMRKKIDVFDRLRDTMRIAVSADNSGLNDDGADADIPTIKEKLEKFKDWILSPEFPFVINDYLGMINQLEKYWDKLFADPITVQTGEGEATIYPQRTNNSMERLFRHLKRNHRRKTGTTQMSRALKAILADTPLVKNLTNPEYVSMILSGKATLAERFSEIDVKLARQKLKEAKTNQQRLPTKLIKLIRREKFIEEINNVFRFAS